MSAANIIPSHVNGVTADDLIRDDDWMEGVMKVAQERGIPPRLLGKFARFTAHSSIKAAAEAGGTEEEFAATARMLLREART